MHGLYWYYFLHQASVDLLAFEKGLEVRMGAKYDGGTNAICWNVDWIRLCLVESLMENQNGLMGGR